MRASSAAFHRSWWSRRTGFIAVVYGDLIPGCRFLLRGNSCGLTAGGGRVGVMQREGEVGFVAVDTARE